jgi:hypothetical protein
MALADQSCLANYDSSANPRLEREFRLSTQVVDKSVHGARVRITKARENNVHAALAKKAPILQTPDISTGCP